jgi:hypothetical protein
MMAEEVEGQWVDSVPARQGEVDECEHAVITCVHDGFMKFAECLMYVEGLRVPNREVWLA